MDLQLIAAVLATVKSNGGALPSTQASKKGAVSSPAWTKIAKKVKEMKGVQEAGKACGSRWVALKARVKVSIHTHDEQTPSRTLAHPVSLFCPL
jgi:hypothetical protein